MWTTIADISVPGYEIHGFQIDHILQELAANLLFALTRKNLLENQVRLGAQMDVASFRRPSSEQNSYKQQ